jgi:hypothetical protein
VCDLADAELQESSGLAASRAHEGVFWTHNDSGDAPRLFAIDRSGATLATPTLEGVREAKDWEDVCAFRWRDEAWLLVGDVGDNDAKRKQVTLHLVEEPAELAEGACVTLPVRATLTVRYEDGPHDCEGVAVDPETGTVLLVSKERKGGAPRVYAVPLTDDVPGEPLVAKKVATLAAPGMTTAFDIAPDGRLAVVLTYLQAYVWTREEGEAWAAALARAPKALNMPLRRQGESICFDAKDGRTLWLTSEKTPTPLWRVPAQVSTPRQ